MPEGLPPKQRLWAVQILRQWFAAALTKFMYLSTPVGEEPDKVHVWQVLELENRSIQVPVFQTESEAAEGKGLYMVLVQRMSVCEDLEQPAAGGERTEITCYPLEEPRKVDILTAVGVQNRDRWLCRSWAVSVSDIPGCQRLHTPSRLQVPMPLTSPTVPVLSLLDELYSRGFRGRQGCCHHDAESPSFYDARAPLGKRMYYMCVLSLPELLGKGVQSFESGAPPAYYELLLRGSTTVQPGQSAKAYRALLSKGVEDGSLPPEPIVRYKASGPEPPPPPIGDIASDSDVAGDEDVALELAPPPPTPPAIEDAPGDGAAAADNGDIFGDDDGQPGADTAMPEAGAGAAGAPRLQHLMIEGMPAQPVPGRSDERWNYFDRLRVRCRNPAHMACYKTRSTALEQDAFGPRAAEYFLGAWQLESHRPEEEHKRFRPSRAMVRAYADAHP